MCCLVEESGLNYKPGEDVFLSFAVCMALGLSSFVLGAVSQGLKLLGYRLSHTYLCLK